MYSTLPQPAREQTLFNIKPLAFLGMDWRLLTLTQNVKFTLYFFTVVRIHDNDYASFIQIPGIFKRLLSI